MTSKKYLMSLASKVRYTFLLFLCVSFSIPVQAQDTPLFDQLRQKFEDNRIFISEFSHLYEDSFTGEQQFAEGQIWIGKERYKIESQDQVMIVDGDISRVYDGSKNRLIISDYIEEEDDFAPSRMLQGVDESYSITEEPAGDGSYRVILFSDDPFSIFEEVIIHVDSQGRPLRIEARDMADNLLTTSFENGEFTDSDDAIFELEIPEGAEQIDLRHETR